MTTEERNDTGLMGDFKKGDAGAEKMIFRQFFRSMCLLAESITSDTMAAEDIVAKTFVKLFGKRSEFEALENIQAFLYVTVRNASYTFKTTHNRRQAVHEQLAKMHIHEMTLPEPPASLEILRVQLLESIYQEIENLPPQCRRISKMIFVEGKTSHEISESLQISPQTVRTQKARAIQLLKSQLFKNEKFEALLALSLFGVIIMTP